MEGLSALFELRKGVWINGSLFRVMRVVRFLVGGRGMDIGSPLNALALSFAGRFLADIGILSSRLVLLKRTGARHFNRGRRSGFMWRSRVVATAAAAGSVVVVDVGHAKRES